jgi:hypothetical protein
MANEIVVRNSSTGVLLYATIRNTSNQYWGGVESSAAWETLVPGGWGDYAIDLAEVVAGGYLFAANFPAGIAAGHYFVDVFEYSSSAPLITDTLVGTISLDWSGAARVHVHDVWADTNEVQADWANGGRLDLLLDGVKSKTDNLPTDPADASDITDLLTTIDGLIDAIKAVTDNLPDSGALSDLAATLEDTNALQSMFVNIDSTSTDTITLGKAVEILLGIIAGNTSYDTTSRVLTVYGRNGTTALWTVKISATVAGTRTESTLAT